MKPRETPSPISERPLIGRYKLVKRLAVGGMAEVFLASEQGELQRLVVLKRILPHLAEQQDFVDMFLREARIAARIRHPNVIQIYELGEANGYPYIAMEYVNGSTLKELLRAIHAHETRIPLGVALQIICQACAGAHAAHELKDSSGSPYNLVHRDISPHNLMVDDDGHVKLLDFGIAKASKGMDTTRTGMLKGKISYMSPEQCRQDHLDRRSDIFSLCILAWELVAGAKPFSGASELATMQAIITANRPDLRTSRADVPENIAVVIAKGLSLDPEDRQSTADQLRRELREAAFDARINLDQDRTAIFVRTLVGDRHDRQRDQVSTALERTLVSFSEMSAIRTGTHQTAFTQGNSGVTVNRAAGVMAGAGFLMFAAGLGAVGVGVALIAYNTTNPFARPTNATMGPNELPPAPPPPDGEPLSFSLAPTLSPEEILRAHEPLRRYLEEEVERPIHFEVARTYDDAASRVATGEVDFAVLPQNTIHVLRQRVDAPILAVMQIDGSSSTDGYLLAPRGFDADLTKARGYTICFSDPLSNTGYRLPSRYLKDHGLDPEKDLKIHFSGNHEQVLIDLLDGLCEFGATHSGNYHTASNRGLQVAQLKILALTGSTPHDAVVANPSLILADRKLIKDALLIYNPEIHHPDLPAPENGRLTGFVPVPKDYEFIDDDDK